MYLIPFCEISSQFYLSFNVILIPHLESNEFDSSCHNRFLCDRNEKRKVFPGSWVLVISFLSKSAWFSLALTKIPEFRNAMSHDGGFYN